MIEDVSDVLASRCILKVELIKFADRTAVPVRERGVKSDCVTISMEVSLTRTGKTVGGAVLGSGVGSQ